jgi:hypothetical protein
MQSGYCHLAACGKTPRNLLENECEQPLPNPA